MMRISRWVWLALLLALGNAPAQEAKKAAPAKETARKENADGLLVHFHDGTVIRAPLVQDTLEVVTEYGKLTVPTAHIRRIDFGLHMPDEVARKVETAVRELESNAFAVRQDASKRLVALGRFAYPALLRSGKGASLETTRRAQQVMQLIRKSYPPYQLKMRAEDVVQTTRFTIVGRIVVPRIMVRTEHFGEAQLKLTDLRYMRGTTYFGEVQVALEGSKYALLDNQWLVTDITVNPDNQYVVTAEGQVDLDTDQAGQFVSGPEGNLRLGRMGQGVPGQLVGRIGDDGAVFVIGRRYKLSPSREGKLQLRIVPFPQTGGATGSYTIKVTSGDE